MQGLMMDMPLLISGLIQYAADYHGEAEIVAAQCLSGRIQPVDVAALALFLASDDAHMCTGHDYFVDAGWR